MYVYCVCVRVLPASFRIVSKPPTHILWPLLAITNKKTEKNLTEKVTQKYLKWLQTRKSETRFCNRENLQNFLKTAARDPPQKPKLFQTHLKRFTAGIYRWVSAGVYIFIDFFPFCHLFPPLQRCTEVSRVILRNAMDQRHSTIILATNLLHLQNGSEQTQFYLYLFISTFLGQTFEKKFSHLRRYRTSAL